MCFLSFTDNTHAREALGWEKKMRQDMSTTDYPEQKQERLLHTEE
jgi:hypothetical protein